MERQNLTEFKTLLDAMLQGLDDGTMTTVKECGATPWPFPTPPTAPPWNRTET